jgi:hypothetical protein
METARAEDPERIELIEMMQAWERVLGWGFSNRWKLSNVITRGTAMVREDQTSPLEPEHPDLYAALEALAARTTGKRGQKPDARMLGTWLRQFKGRIVDGKRFMNQPNDKSGSEWWVERVNKSANADATEEGGIGGYEGVSSGPTPASSHNQGSALF